MSMSELIAVIWRRRSIVAVVTALVFVAGTAIVLFGATRRTYTAKAEIMLDQPALFGTVDGQNVTTKLTSFLPTACSVLDGDGAVAEVAKRAGETPDTVRSKVDCHPRANTTIADVQSTTASAPRSQRLTAAASDVLISTIHDRYGRPDAPAANRIDATVLVAARTPGADSRHTARQLALVAVGALILAVALAVAAEPHRRDGLWSSQVDPGLVWVPMPEARVPAANSANHSGEPT